VLEATGMVVRLEPKALTTVVGRPPTGGYVDCLHVAQYTTAPPCCASLIIVVVNIEDFAECNDSVAGVGVGVERAAHRPEA
jgi:hypothetical protein